MLLAVLHEAVHGRGQVRVAPAVEVSWTMSARLCSRLQPGRAVVPTVVTLVAVTLLLAVIGCSAGPTETRDDSFTVSESPELVVRSDNGSIEVNSGPEGEVRVEATLRGADRIEYEVRQDGDEITVDVRIDGGWQFFRPSPEADITVTAPSTTDMDLRTSNGSIELSDIEGSGTLDTSNGKIVLGNVTGDFNGNTSNGAIEIDGMEGKAVLATSNGRVDVQQANGSFDVRTSNGDISFSGEMTAGGTNRLVTSNGSVDVVLEGEPSVSLEASTSSGEITTDLPIDVESSDEDSLVGTIGAGEADLYIRTSNGDVTIS